MELLERLWSGILDLTELFVIPDWGSVIALLPLFVSLVLVAFLVGTVVRYRRLGARRRRPGRIKPLTPPGVHMPGPTYAPVFAAVGSFLMFLGLVFGGLILVLGLIALLLTLLYWGREGLTDYDHVANEHPALPPVVHPGPPPGVHMPGPSFRPILASLGATVLFAGLVFGGWVLVVGLVFMITALLGWLNDARKEYRQVVRADETGHLENEPAPGWPKAVLGVFTVLVLASVALTAGWFPPRSTVGGSAGPGASGAPGGSAAPGASGAPAQGALTVIAQGVKFDVASLAAPADKPFAIAFDNRDGGIPHDVDIKDGAGAIAFNGKEFPGPAQKTYDVPALKAGSYTFFCSIHPTMTGTLTVGG